MLKRKNVVGFGDGIKRVGNVPTGEKALIFFVEKKTSDLSKKDLIPKKINGIKTDVIETGKFSPLLLSDCSTVIRNTTIHHLRGGIVMGCASLDAIGTLGTLVQDRKTNKVVGLTCSHVAGNPLFCTDAEAQLLLDDNVEFIRAQTAVGEQVYQNYRPDGVNFGEVTADYGGNFYKPLEIDSALVSIKSSVGVTPGIMGLTKYAQTFQSITTVPPGQIVYKSGRTTGTTEGSVTSINATVLVEVGGGLYKEFKNQTIITPSTGVFADGGDSGAVVCVDRGNGRVSIIGQVHAGSASTGIVMSCPIDAIVSNLDIVPWDGSIVLTENHSDTVGTNFGAIYHTDSTVFLSTTNDTVTENALCPITPLQITRCEHYVISKDNYSGGDIPISETELSSQLDVNQDVSLAVSLDCLGGAELNQDVQLITTLDAEIFNNQPLNLSSSISLRVLSDSVLSNRRGISADLSKAVLIKITPDISLMQKLPLEVDTNCPIVVTLDAVITNASGVDINLDSDINLGVTLDSTMGTTSLDFGSGHSVWACDSTNADDIIYEGCA